MTLYEAALLAEFQHLTDNIGMQIPTTYSMALDIVESLYGYLSDSSSQLNPLSKGCPNRKNKRIGNPTGTETNTEVTAVK
jgi:hypothetical protein